MPVEAIPELAVGEKAPQSQPCCDAVSLRLEEKFDEKKAF
jgi:hypothetical protein